MNDPKQKEPQAKSAHAEREERILASWKEKGIFEKSLESPPAGGSPEGEFVFYEGPPTANGRPALHHLEARAFKDAIPRYKTMRGYHVRRKGGWDTHGLPVELQVEKALGFKSKKEIETYGIDGFQREMQGERLGLHPRMGELHRPHRLLGRPQASLHHLQSGLHGSALGYHQESR